MDYDLIVIGSGPAGEKGAAQAAYFGKRVALIEAGREPGGACVHTGTLPSKTLRESALYLSGLKSRGLYGVNYLVRRDISAQDFLFRMRHVEQVEVARIRRNFDKHRVDLIQGRASFLDAHTVQIDNGHQVRKLRGEKILIATGSKPVHPDYLPTDHSHVYDSDTILKMDHIPRSLCVIGAGVIGCEYATIFAALGTRVILLDGHPTMLPFLDRELSDKLREEMMRLGMQLLLREKLQAVEPDGENLNLVLGSGDDLEVEAILFAAGREGNARNLGLEGLGIDVGSRGHITVNERFQTVVPNIYAAGDVIGFPALASTSMEQARVAMCHAFDLKYKEGVGKHLPFGIYTIPEVSCVGDSEEALQKAGVAYEVGRARFVDNARGQIIGDEGGLLKLVFERDTLKLRGVHIIGERASELVHVGQAVLQLGAGIDYFIQAVFNYPTLSEAYKYAAYDGLGRLAAAVQRDGVHALNS